MDKKRSLLNVGVSIAFKLLLLFGSILVRRIVIQFLGNDINGLNSLYLSIIGFLSVAELGIGTAISFSMYKPIIQGRKETVAALFILFKKINLLIGGFILISGLLITPFLPFIIGDYGNLSIDVYLPFVLMLFSVVLTYLYSAKVSLINAYKDNYITTSIASICELLMYALQIVVIIVTKSFAAFLLVRIFIALLETLLINVVTKRMHGDILSINSRLDQETKKEVSNSVKAMFMHKIGGVLVSTVDSVIISAFIGVAILGKYSNYTAIMTAMVGILSLFFSPLTSIVGHLYAEGDDRKTLKYFNFFYKFNFLIGVIFFLGYYAIIDNLISLFFADNLVLSKTISFVITLNQFIQFMRKATLLFKDASGKFYNDRWKPIAEGIANLILSILFVLLLPSDYNVVGVIVATIITTLTICYIVEPFILFKYTFKKNSKSFIISNYLHIILFTILLIFLSLIAIRTGDNAFELLINGFISVGISFIVCMATFLLDGNFRRFLKKAFCNIRHRKVLKI